jgi:hypothetical protein
MASLIVFKCALNFAYRFNPSEKGKTEAKR